MDPTKPTLDVEPRRLSLENKVCFSDTELHKMSSPSTERSKHPGFETRRRVISVSQDFLFSNSDDETKTETEHNIDVNNESEEDIDRILDSRDEMEDSILELDFPSTPRVLKNIPGISLPVEPPFVFSDEEEQSIYQAQLMSNGQDVKLIRERSRHPRRVISVPQDFLFGNSDDETKTETEHNIDVNNESEEDIDRILDSPDEIEDSILEQLSKEGVEPIPELTAEEELMESRSWRSCTVAGVERKIDLKVLEPYKRVVSHGGYLSQGSKNAIIVFSACFLPDRSRFDYDYVMNNLFLYVLTTLDQLITDDYVLIYLHGATSRSCMPKFNWLKQCYQMIDRKLRKNLKGLYLVHPTFWVKTMIVMTKPFVSTKFSRKLFYINSLSELFRKIPLEPASIPDKVKKYDYAKFQIRSILESY